ncbi:GPW/gp25 family protein [Paraburkholderia graminis]|uniref:GPW/gp25 family protein n=1 Tax=Paraburkholderia graminis TaxID=60548 RepID=UPI0038B9ED48
MAQNERKDFLGRGWAMPVALDARTGVVAEAEYEEDIRESIRIIIETVPGERVMRPDFGCGIHELVFASMDSQTLQRARSTVEEALRRYEPRIEIIEVSVDEESALTDGSLKIELDYRVRKTNQVGNLVFPFYFREGGQR